MKTNERPSTSGGISSKSTPRLVNIEIRPRKTDIKVKTQPESPKFIAEDLKTKAKELSGVETKQEPV